MNTINGKNIKRFFSILVRNILFEQAMASVNDRDQKLEEINE